MMLSQGFWQITWQRNLKKKGGALMPDQYDMNAWKLDEITWEEMMDELDEIDLASEIELMRDIEYEVTDSNELPF